MKKIVTIALFSISQTLSATIWQPTDWPTLKHYDQQHLQQIALPLGGIGTGTLSLGGRGEIRDWEIMNVPGKKFSTVTTGNNAPLFAIYTKENGKAPITTGLIGPLYDNEYLHYEGRPVNHHGIPRFQAATFDAAYPFGQVNLSSDNVPVKVRIKGFNPLIPGDEDGSSLPIAVLTFEVTNTSSQTVDFSICGAMRNFVGKDGSKFRTDWKGDYVPIGAKGNRNEFRNGTSVRGIYMSSDKVDKNDPAWGTIALTTNAENGITSRTSSVADDWNNAILDFWDDFSDDGKLTERNHSGEDDPMCSLAVSNTLNPGETKKINFFITWNFPNRKAWSSEIVGNYYSKTYNDAWNNAERIVPMLPDLERRTLLFVNTLLASSYPDVIKEAALFNLSTLRSQTVFRTADGHLMGWEGVMDRFGSCQGSCTHVWNYETAVPFLFGKQALTMRDVEFNYSLKDNGLMNFRAALPLKYASDGNSAAADGQLGCIMKVYRDWQLSGNNEFLRKMWPQVKKALSYSWATNSWDANADGVMEGSQHNTMDVNYFGPNSQMEFWYMGALKAASHMARFMNDKPFMKKCDDIYAQGSKWIDANLFNGEYYEQRITDPQTHEYINMDDPNTNIPSFQLGKACLVDQLVGQYMAHICGLGYLANENNIKTTMESVMKYNFKDDFSEHFNNMRSYVMGNEAGLLMASWPKGRLKVPFPYFAEVMTGFEYTAATGMIYEGQTDNALKCIRAIRDRFDGAKRNPFSEPECGHHYARSMASWSTLLAFSRFHYSAVTSTLTITHNDGTYFWSNGYSWGSIKVAGNNITVSVLSGELEIKEIGFNGEKKKKVKPTIIAQGTSASFIIETDLRNGIYNRQIEVKH